MVLKLKIYSSISYLWKMVMVGECSEKLLNMEQVPM